jgi:branched-chain amino acid transport system ATP-binding protein
MLLNYKNVEVLYNNIILALKGVTLEVTEGNIVSILGANGAGKSTILRSISGLLSLEGGRVSSGEIDFEGKRIDGMEPSQIARSRISMVVEGRGLFRSLNVEENLKVGTLMRRDGRKKIREDLDVVFQIFPVLKERRMQISGTMSGGEQQMLCIAMGMMTKPKLLLLDEPSLGLAPIVSEQVFEAVKRINVELGTTILLVEQNAFLSLAISDFAYVMTIGNIALKARAEELVGKDISRYYLGTGAKNTL